ncbi:hypothetical protein [Saccharicrinis sp. FJH54]|uniref:hypothetical protein n=1 Tax=Saccharicrinis sp. FJH54 TaxID=3344665 RepID=UPI0035D45A4A
MITLSVDKHNKAQVREAEAKNLYIDASEQEMSEDTIHYSDFYNTISEIINVNASDYICPSFTGNFSPPKIRSYITDEAFDDYSLFPNPPPYFS